MSNSSIGFTVTSPHLSAQEKGQLVEALHSRFNGERGMEELSASTGEGGQHVVVPNGPLGIDRYICFVPQIPGGVGRIDMYAEEGGCGGESNRLHSYGHVEYRAL